jgi:hypothetical protein
MIAGHAGKPVCFAHTRSDKGDTARHTVNALGKLNTAMQFFSKHY